MRYDFVPMSSRSLLAIGAILALLGAGCAPVQPSSEYTASDPLKIPPLESSGSVATGQTLALASMAFENGQAIPERYTCKGQDFSPPLAFGGVPSGTVSLALTMEDSDAQGATYDHWVAFNMPATTPGIPEGDIVPGSLGTTTDGQMRYVGPCPPSGTHRYVFRLYALNKPLDLEDGATKAELLQAMQGSIIQQAELVGMFGE